MYSYERLTQGHNGFALLQFTHTCDDLSQAAQSDAHSHNNDGQRQQTGIVQVEKYGSHAEAQQTQRARIGNLCGSGY